MSARKSPRELAYIYDLYIAPDWGERFAEVVDEHVKLPNEGRVLYVLVGTGGHALALQQRGSQKLNFVFVDESADRIELARAKALSIKRPIPATFEQMLADSLTFEDGLFDLVIVDASLVQPDRVPEVLEEASRVARDGSQVALSIASASSFGEFFSIYWEALIETGHEGHGRIVEELISEQVKVSDLEDMAKRAGLAEVKSWTRREEFEFASGEEFINSPLITDQFYENWFYGFSDEGERSEVLNRIAALIDEEREELTFNLSIKATLLSGIKAG